MRLADLRRVVADSAPEDWEVLPPGPDYLDRFSQVGAGDRTWLELGWHSALAVLRDDVDVRIAFGMEVDRDLDLGWTFPDPQVTRDLVDLFYRGALVFRWSVFSVDGGRAYLPQVDPAAEVTGPSSTQVHPVAQYASPEDVKIARLAHVFDGGRAEDFTSYLGRSKIVERPA